MTGSLSETNAFAAINWVVGNGQSRAEGGLGVMHSEGEPNGDAKAVQGSVHVNLPGGPNFDKVRVAALSGKDNVMAMVGLGYGSAGAFGTVGVWGPYLIGGVDGYFGGGFETFVGLHSLGRLDRPSAPQIVFVRSGD